MIFCISNNGTTAWIYILTAGHCLSRLDGFVLEFFFTLPTYTASFKCNGLLLVERVSEQKALQLPMFLQVSDWLRSCSNIVFSDLYMHS